MNHKKYLSQIGRQGGLIGGKAKSAAKTAAVRLNAQKPRSRKNQITDTLLAILLLFFCVGIVMADPLLPNWKQITLANGKTIPVLKILAVDAYKIQWISDSSAGSTEIADLTRDEQKQLGYDAAAAVQAIAAEKARQVATDLQNDKIMLSDKATKSHQDPQTTIIPQTTSRGASLSPAQQQVIQAQISDLQSDVAFMQVEEAKLDSNNRLKKTGDKYTEGAYPEKIQVEKSEIQQLQQEL